MIDDDIIQGQLKKIWEQCKICKHLHTRMSLGHCTKQCCEQFMEPVQVRICNGECFGHGYYKEQIDEDQPRREIQCSKCRGLGVIPC